MESVPLLLRKELTLLYVSDLISCNLSIMPYFPFLSSIPLETQPIKTFMERHYYLTQLQMFPIFYFAIPLGITQFLSLFHHLDLLQYELQLFFKIKDLVKSSFYCLSDPNSLPKTCEHLVCPYVFSLIFSPLVPFHKFLLTFLPPPDQITFFSFPCQFLFLAMKIWFRTLQGISLDYQILPDSILS